MEVPFIDLRAQAAALGDELDSHDPVGCQQDIAQLVVDLQMIGARWKKRLVVSSMLDVPSGKLPVSLRSPRRKRTGTS